MKLCPSDIRYTQDSIGNTFNFRCQHRNKMIGGTLDDVCEKRCSIYSIPTISVASLSGKWRTADNRRLWVFKQLEILGKCNEIPVNKISIIPSFKRTSNNDGQSVRIRGCPGGTWYKIAEKTTFKKPRQECRSEDLSKLNAPGGMSQSHTLGGDIQLRAPLQSHVAGGLQQSLASEDLSKTLATGILLQPNAPRDLVQNHSPGGMPLSYWPGSRSQFLMERDLEVQTRSKAQRGLSQSFARRHPPHPFTPEGLHQSNLLRSLLNSYSLRDLPQSHAPWSMTKQTTLDYLQQLFRREGASRSCARRSMLRSQRRRGLSEPYARKGLSHAYVPSLALSKIRQEVTVYSDSDESLDQTYESDRNDDTDQAYENESNDSISQTYGSDTGSDDSTAYKTDTCSDDSMYQTYESDSDVSSNQTYDSVGDDTINQTYESDSDVSSDQTYETDSDDSLNHLFECDCDTLTSKTFESDDDSMIKAYESDDEDSLNQTDESDGDDQYI